MQFEERSSYLDTQTGEVHTVSREVLGLAESGDSPEELPDWQHEEYRVARLILEGDRFVRLPTKWDVHEWDSMDQFARSLDDDEMSGRLLSAIRGAGAFRRFKEEIRRCRVEDAWFAYRSGALRQIAAEWCEENGIRYRED